MGHLKGFWVSPSWRRNISEGLVARYGNARVLVLSICAGTFARKVTLTKSTPGVEISSLRSKRGPYRVYLGYLCVFITCYVL